MQHSDWDQVFEEVEREIHELLVGQAVQIEKAFQLNSHKLEVALKVGLEDGDGGFGVSVDINFVKERIKTGTRKSLVLGQIDLPGFTARQAQPERQPVTDESRMLGAGAPQLAAGEPLNLGPGQGGFSCEDGMEYTDVENRLMRVKEMAPEQLRAVIALPGCQKSVVKAAERRLRKLESEATKSGMSYEANAKSCRNCQNNLPGGCEVEGECDNDLSRWAEVGAA